MTACALVPIKNFAVAKTRLRTVLRADETSFLAEQMAIATFAALTLSRAIDRLVVLADAETGAKIADRFSCEFASDDSHLDLSTNLFTAARALDLESADTLAIFPADIPLVTPADIDNLFIQHESGLAICPAARDGGTNALVVTPPDAIGFHFGENSALRHAEAGRAAGLPVQFIDSPNFARDIDTAEDLEWLCRTLPEGEFLEALQVRGIVDRLLHSSTALYA